eukprot:gene31687-6892_t
MEFETWIDEIEKALSIFSNEFGFEFESRIDEIEKALSIFSKVKVLVQA